VTLLINKGGNVNARSRIGERFNETPESSASTQLSRSSAHQHLHCAQYTAGHTPLHLACRYGHIPVALALLVKGCELDATDNEGVCFDRAERQAR
jgi:ankyrin repeat protein